VALTKVGLSGLPPSKIPGQSPCAVRVRKEKAVVRIVKELAIAAATFRCQTTVTGATRALNLDHRSEETWGQLGGKVVDQVSNDLTKYAVQEIVHVNLDAGPFILQLAADVFDVAATADERPGLFGLICSSSHVIWQSSS
jgi:hypothetical protein